MKANRVHFNLFSVRLSLAAINTLIAVFIALAPSESAVRLPEGTGLHFQSVFDSFC